MTTSKEDSIITNISKRSSNISNNAINENVENDPCNVLPHASATDIAFGDADNCNVTKAPDKKMSAKVKKKEEEVRDPYVLEKIRAGVPIDHGWAWMIVLGCHAMCLMISGIVRSHGILLIEISELFETSTLDSVWSLSMVSLFVTVLAPFSNSLAVRYSCRAVCFCGTVFIVSGLLLTSFARSLNFIYFSYGTLVGIGFGLCYSPAMCMVGYYFDKRRTIANGISVAGSSMGSFILPVLIEHLITEYSCKGAFILLAGVMLHLAVIAALLRPMEFYVNLHNKSQSSGLKMQEVVVESVPATDPANHPECKILGEQNSNANMESPDNMNSNKKGSVERQSLVRSRYTVHPTLATLEENDDDNCDDKSEEKELFFQSIDENDHNTGHQMTPKDGSECRLDVARLFKSVISLHSTCSANFLSDQPKLTRSCNSVIVTDPKRDNNQEPSGDLTTHSGPQTEAFSRRMSDSDMDSAQNTFTSFSGKPIFSESTLHTVRKEMVRLGQNKNRTRNIPLSESYHDITRLFSRATQFLATRTNHNNSDPMSSNRALIVSGMDLTLASLQNLPCDPSEGIKKADDRNKLGLAVAEFCKMRQKVITTGGKVKKSRGVALYDPWVLRQPSFYLLSLAISIGLNVFGIIFMILPAHAHDLGFDKKSASRLIIYCGITDLIGRLVTGFIADSCQCFSRSYILVANLLIMAANWVFITQGSSYTSLVIFCLSISLAGGSNMSLYAVVIVDALGVERLSSAYGLTLFTSGMFGFGHTLLASWIRDFTGTWFWAFYLNISLTLVAVALIMVQIFYSKFKNAERPSKTYSPVNH